MLHEEALTEQILGAAIEVHRALGPGLLESAYEHCLCHELSLRSIPWRRQVDLPVPYKGLQLESAYRLDILVRDAVIVEVKAVDDLTAIHHQQLLTYLRLGACRVGLLLNFNVRSMRNGIVRKIV
jgi:GxxExxY protein